MNKLTERLKQLRIQRNVLQKELAHHLHVTTGTISNHENGVHTPDLDTLCKIARYYGVSADYLIGLTDCPCSVDTLNQVISGGYTVGQFLALLDQLDPKDRAHLVWILRLLGK